MKRRLLLLALLFADAAAAQTELVVWHSYRAAEKAAIEKVAAAFNASHPGTRVTTLAVPYDAFADKISAAVPRGKGPDIFIYAQDRLGGWIEAGQRDKALDPRLPPVAILYTLYARACDPVVGFLRAGGQHSDEQIVSLIVNTCFDGLSAR